MKVFKIYGKNSVSQDISDGTFKTVDTHKGADDVVVFVDMDTSEGYVEALASNIYYIPTIVCEDADGNELGYIEHSRESVSQWYSDIKEFIEDLREATE
jgi:hypothetical protein